jgi:hypothetical protein
MGSTYETDTVNKRDELTLALQAALVVKMVSNLVSCPSWLLARLTLRELRQRVDELAKTIEAGSK